MAKRILTLFTAMLLVFTVSAAAALPSITMKDFGNGHVNFDGDNFKIEFTLSTGGSDGILYVYPKGAVPGDSVASLYTNFVAANETVSEIGFFSSGENMINTGEYIIAFYTAAGSDAEYFTYCTEAELLTKRKAALLSSLKALQNPNGSAIEALIDSDGTGASEVFGWIKAQADMTSYNKVNDKSTVYAKMVSGIGSITDEFSSLVALFESGASQALAAQTGGNGGTDTQNPSNPGNVITQTGGGSGGGGGGGGAVSNKPSDNEISLPGDNKGDEENSGDNVNSSSFGDMTGHWAAKYAEALFEKGIMNGYGDGSFGGDNNMTRAELAKTLVEAIGIDYVAEADYTDVAQGAWYAGYIAKAAKAGIVTGFEDGSFRPDVGIIRQDAALMVYRALKLKCDIPEGFAFFADDLEIAAYASEAIRSLGDLGIITGDENKAFNPEANITRAELAALICRALDYIEAH